VTALVLRPAAVAELTEAHAHDHDPADGLGDRFVVVLDELFAWLAEFPRSVPDVAGYRDVRRAVVCGDRSVVFYRHQPDRVVVLRVLDAARSDADRAPGEPLR
jgi:plasmid stabilization system protein ParE